VLAIVDDKVADTESGSVTILPPEKEDDEDVDGTVDNHIKIDTEDGEIRVVSSYTDPVTIEGSASGSGLSIANNLQTRRPLGILPGRFADVFSGELPPESSGEIMTFDRLTRISLETSRPFVWSVDGEKSGKGKKFQKQLVTE